MPTIIAKCEGRYFKYRNTGSYGKQWWLYSHCLECTNTRFGIFNTFQTSEYSNEFKLRESSSYHLTEIEITKEEFSTALEAFKQLLLKM